MNTLTRHTNQGRWNPWKEMEALHERLNSFFDRPAMRDEEEVSLAEWTPAVDISERDEEYVITAELPGLRKEEVDVSMEAGTLTIKGARKLEKEEKNKKYHRIERSYGHFVRSFTLPNNADANRISAEFKEGLLTVHLPKTEQSKPKSIPVNVT